jgi:protein FAM50
LEAQKKLERKTKQQKLKQRKKLLSTLSFAHDDEVIHESTVVVDTTQKPSLKDPTIDTSFLPDKQRDQQRELERLRLEQEWKCQQDIIRQELLQITYSYWDGSGHRRSVTVKKGDTIGVFLELVRKDLCSEFREMHAIACDALMYVKEDLMLPQDITFYDLIVTKARGKSGPLFHFDVHDDVRLGPLDSRVEKDESHPGKVVARQWYDRNKHIFPASRWELYDPTKTYGNYTIHGGEVNKGEGKKK